MEITLTRSYVVYSIDEWESIRFDMRVDGWIEKDSKFYNRLTDYVEKDCIVITFYKEVEI